MEGSLWREGGRVRVGNDVWELRLDDGVEVGSIEPTSVWTDAADVRLPHTMPLQLQVFIVGVVAIQWRRAQSSSVAATT